MHYGKQALAGIGVTTPMILAISVFSVDHMNIAMQPLLGLVQGAQPLLSYSLGTRSIPRVKEAFRLLRVWSVPHTFWRVCTDGAAAGRGPP